MNSRSARRLQPRIGCPRDTRAAHLPGCHAWRTLGRQPSLHQGAYRDPETASARPPKAARCVTWPRVPSRIPISFRRKASAPGRRTPVTRNCAPMGLSGSVMGYGTIHVPVMPLRPSTSLSSEVIRVLRPGPDVVNPKAARILGSIEPSGNWPSAMYFSA